MIGWLFFLCASSLSSRLATCVRVALQTNEQECISTRAQAGQEVIIKFEAFPSDESRIRTHINRQQFQSNTLTPTGAIQHLRSVPAWNTGFLNLTADVFSEHDTKLGVCLENTSKGISEVTFTISLT
eukprot:Gregarina_sp_Pseudo_9__2578@NODE_2844_length_853_cov_9_132678_g2604_i0_p1_GENE_NODE_2844_length_853_cov_9_132678_g2604_i0NODE_2844_length_853_cov_9_132678_g2604_i0_p1_ORF_typecomplete_len127_score21_30EMP24_GP25L/PF01105_24/0_016_NODE_2844_length_853_cov_9_132678_g2604_i0173553